MNQIVQHPSGALRKVSLPLDTSDFQGVEIRNLIKKMTKVLDAESDGVGLAAPQIGVSKRVFIISPKVFEEKEKMQLVYINPEIIKKSGRNVEQDEGCLSVRGMFGKIKRQEKVRVRALDLSGKVFERGASGLIAEIFQHEIDHLDGKLFIDSAKDVREILPDVKD